MGEAALIDLLDGDEASRSEVECFVHAAECTLTQLLPRVVPLRDDGLACPRYSGG